MYGQTLQGGLLLWGPPGCGKTFLGKALAGELGAKFINVGIDDVLDMWKGQSEKNLHALFEKARRDAPAVLFLDEVDALGFKRTRHGSDRMLVSQLLSDLDGVSSDNAGVFVVGATNHPWDVDSALKRPGRLGRMVCVLPPDSEAREAILRRELAERPIGDDVDVAAIAAETEGYSGADLVHLCGVAVELALERALDTGAVAPIVQDMLVRAQQDTQPSIGAWLQTARNYAEFSNERGVFDDFLTYLRSRNDSPEKP